MSEIADVVIIGAGVVGLAIARDLAMAGRDVIIVEQADTIGTHTSSRNSEVIHAGIYYQPGSRKARHCVRGKALLYDYCAAHGVPYKRITKLIVAVDPSQASELERIQANATNNGVDDLELLDGAQVAALESNVRAAAALLSPSTGIIDTHSLMLAYQGDAEEHGAMLALRSRFTGASVRNDGIDVNVDLAGENMTLRARTLVNSAGLFAPAVANAIDALAAANVPAAHFAKGNYFTLTGKAPFTRLIYPLPEPGGLGVHITLDLGGGARFGPDVQWLDAIDPEAIDYGVDPARAERFYPAIRSWYPALAERAIIPGYAGIRPKIAARGEPAADFQIQGPAEHGVAGLVNLFGIESPGVTASLAIAEEVGEIVARSE
ncbi:MAG: FAD-dependent oxidoreductase [Gammaproteobacteria bacterium]|nr:FAD-dependent oxidoreductase [Gammaproteobacteria bacterium]